MTSRVEAAGMRGDLPWTGEPLEAPLPGDTVVLDVGGDRFTAKREVLLQRPTTRLGKLMKARDAEDVVQVAAPLSLDLSQLCEEFFPGDPPEFFFDRNPENFPAILDMHRSGMFHMSDGGCALVLQKV